MKQNSALITARFRTISLSMSALMLSLLVGRSETTEDFHKTLTVKPGGQLVVEVDFGAIEITTHTSDQVAIHVARRVSRGGKADEEAFLQACPVIVSQEGDTVNIRSKAVTREAWSWKGHQRAEGKYTIVLPAKFNARLKTSGGNIGMKDVQGEIEVQTSGGDIEIREIQGQAKLNTSGGRIKVNGGSGSLSGRTSGGAVEVKSYHGAVRASTSGGDVQMEDVVGTIEGSTSGGNVSASLRSLSDPIRLSTSGGSVTLRVPADAAFDLDASTSSGSASSELPVTSKGRQADGHLKGLINGGGKLVTLRTSHGSLWVKKL
jgi:DUF4097 and DUF4098 domain-containing protein YvlB